MNSVPTTNNTLCLAGTASAVSGTGPWSWTCTAGTSVSCSANLIVNAACGSASPGPSATAPVAGLCAPGTPSSVVGNGPWNWTCGGLNTGTSTYCAATPATFTQSLNGLALPTSTGPIVDASGNFWTLTATGQISKNGIVDTATGQVTLLLYSNNTVYQETSIVQNGVNLWWYWNSSSGWVGPTGVSDPRSIPSPNGATLPNPPLTQLVDGSGNIWALTSGQQIEQNGTPFGLTGNVVLLLYYNGVIYQEALNYGVYGWWSWAAASGWTMLSGDPRTAAPPPVAIAVNGACGGANGGLSTTAPSSNLCAVGTQSTVSGSGPWSWSCAGSNGGSTAPCSASLPTAATPHLGQAIPSTLFGMHGYFTNDIAPAVPHGSVGKVACQSWAEAEQTRGVYNWANFDFEKSQADALGDDGFVTVYGTPAWAVSPANQALAFAGTGCSTSCGYQICDGVVPDNLSDITTFWTAYAQKYCGTSLKYLELGNEAYGEWENNPAGFATFTTTIYNAVRAACPSMKIISPTLTAGTNDPSYYEGFGEQYYQHGAPTGVDVVSIHAYSDYGNIQSQPEAIMPGGWLFDNRLIDDINTYLPGKPLWNTEGSWDYNTTTIWNTPDLKAAFISRWYILHWAAGFERMYWYAWDEVNVGTIDPAVIGSSVPANAYTQTYNWLVGNTMYNSCSSASNGTWTCPLAGPNGYNGLLVWNTAGTISYTPPSGASTYTQYRDLAGNVTPYSSGTISIGVKPILIEN